MKISMDWKKGLKFTGQSRFGHEISTDGAKKVGGAEEGYQPMELLLFGLAGCTGIDVVMIAKKMRQDITDFKIEIDGEQKEEHPRAFIKAHINYLFKGKNLDPALIEKAINLSEERYCSVSASMKDVVEITHSFKIEEN